MLAAVEAPVILMSKNRQGSATSIVDPVNEGASIRRAIILPPAATLNENASLTTRHYGFLSRLA
jgi:hypothetical protein